MEQHFPVSSSSPPPETRQPAEDEVAGVAAAALHLPAGVAPRPLHRAALQGLRLALWLQYPGTWLDLVSLLIWVAMRHDHHRNNTEIIYEVCYKPLLRPTTTTTRPIAGGLVGNGSATVVDAGSVGILTTRLNQGPGKAAASMTLTYSKVDLTDSKR